MSEILKNDFITSEILISDEWDNHIGDFICF
jgi:hypothetical protein